MNQFDRLETVAQRLIEGGFARLFQTELHPADLAHHLAKAIESGPQKIDQTGTRLVPDSYRVTLNPGDYIKLVSESTIDAETAHLRRYLMRLIREANCRPAGSIQVTLNQSATVRPGKVNIDSHYTNGNDVKPRTKTKETFQVVEDKAEQWWLRVDGRQIQLGQPVLRIGRALDNDIVLSNQTVSRYHTQLRWRDGCYHLHPPILPKIITEQEPTIRLDTPTLVNAQPITQAPLQHDDVITLGSTNLRVVVQSNL